MPSLTIATQRRKQCSVFLWSWRSCSEATQRMKNSVIWHEIDIAVKCTCVCVCVSALIICSVHVTCHALFVAVQTTSQCGLCLR